MSKVELANEILRSIGTTTGRLSAMIGAKNFVALENGIGFKFPRSNGVNYIRITLNGKDLFDIEYLYVTTKKITTKKVSNDMYNDMVKEDIEQTIKMYLSL